MPPKKDSPTPEIDLPRATRCVREYLNDLVWTGALLLIALVLILIFLVWQLPYIVIAVGVISFFAAILYGNIASDNTFSGLRNKTIAEAGKKLRICCGILSALFVACILASIICGLAAIGTRSNRQVYVNRRAQLSEITQGMIQAENTLYYKYNHYSLAPALDIYPTHPALAALATQHGIKVEVSDASAFPGHSILITIKIPAIGFFWPGAKETTFGLALVNGKAKTVLCHGSRHLGCHNEKWTLKEEN